MKETKCDVCGKVLSAEELSEFDGKMLCSQCLCEETIICDHCGTRIWADEDQGNHGLSLCQRCFDNYYTCCAHCDMVIRLNEALYDQNDEPCCCTCYEEHEERRAIHDYYHKPKPIFYGEDKRFFGVELEVDDGGEINRNAERILNIANLEEKRIYCKHDGSLNDGFETVSYGTT